MKVNHHLKLSCIVQYIKIIFYHALLLALEKINFYTRNTQFF